MSFKNPFCFTSTQDWYISGHILGFSLFSLLTAWSHPLSCPTCAADSQLIAQTSLMNLYYSTAFLTPLRCNRDNSNSACPDFICSFSNCLLSIYCEPILGAGERGIIKHILSPATEVYIKGAYSPGWCVSVDWALAWEPKHCWFDSQSGQVPGLQARSLVGGMLGACERQPISLMFSLPPFLPLFTSL